jgi:hypothetical protein
MRGEIPRLSCRRGSRTQSRHDLASSPVTEHYVANAWAEEIEQKDFECCACPSQIIYLLFC